MKITNKTRYSTRTLRSIFAATYRDLAKTEGTLPSWTWESYTFQVVYAKRDHYTGCAAYNGSWACIRLPHEAARTQDIANLVLHELLHSYGYRHKGMGGRHYPWGTSAGIRPDIIARFGERIREVTPKPKQKRATVDLQEHRHGLVLAGITRWEKRAKTATVRLKNLRRKARYYEKALAARRAK